MTKIGIRLGCCGCYGALRQMLRQKWRESADVTLLRIWALPGFEMGDLGNHGNFGAPVCDGFWVQSHGRLWVQLRRELWSVQAARAGKDARGPREERAGCRLR